MRPGSEQSPRFVQPVSSAGQKKTPGEHKAPSGGFKFLNDFKHLALQKIGVPTGIRTPVTAVKGRCPRPLDDGDVFASNRVEESQLPPNFILFNTFRQFFLFLAMRWQAP